MVQQSPPSLSVIDFELLQRFLAAPPAGVPAGVLEMIREHCTGSGSLPPRLFLETVEQAPVAISITDPAARILYVNSAFEQLTGFGRGEVVGQNESLLSSKSTPLSVYQSLWETIQDHRVWRGVLVNHRKDKSEYVAELVISPVLNALKQTVYYLGMHRDITELHQLEQRLKFQKGLTEAALDAAPMVVAMVDPERRVLLDNHAYKVLMGDLRGSEPSELFLHALQQQAGIDLSNVCHTGSGFTNIDVRLDSPGMSSPRWFVCSGVPVAQPDEGANSYFKPARMARCCLLLVANEVTAHRNRLNEARLNMIRASMAEQRMTQTMREALSGAIFKLQVPLNVIRAALAMPASGDSAGLRQVLAQALESGDEAMESLRHALPNPVAEPVARVNVNELLHEVLRISTERLLASDIVVEWRPAAVLPTIPAHANALRGLFKSLIDNAIQALNQSGRNERELLLSTRLDQQELLIEFADNGPGIAREERLKVFEPFYCGWNRAADHAGMGLTMAQEVVNEHNGSIEIDGDYLGGCRLLVRLPLDGMQGE